MSRAVPRPYLAPTEGEGALEPGEGEAPSPFGWDGWDSHASGDDDGDEFELEVEDDDEFDLDFEHDVPISEAPKGTFVLAPQTLALGTQVTGTVTLENPTYLASQNVIAVKIYKVTTNSDDEVTHMSLERTLARETDGQTVYSFTYDPTAGDVAAGDVQFAGMIFP